MRVLNLSTVEIFWLAQVGVCKTGVRDLLLLAQVGGCKTGLRDVLWLARGGDFGTWISDVLCLTQLGGVRIGVPNSLLQGQCGMLQETIEDGWLCSFPGAPSLPTLSYFYCFLHAVPLLGQRFLFQLVREDSWYGHL